MQTQNFSHQQGLFNPARASHVTLIGAGSVGSFVAYFLAKMGVPNIEIWDGDSVDSYNCPMSYFEPGDVGRYKVDVLEQRLRTTQVIPHRKMYEGEPLAPGAVVCCVDTMAVRKLIWEKVKLSPMIPIFLDTRVHQWYAEVLAINPSDFTEIKDYDALAYPDEKAERQICGLHGVLPVSVRAAQLVVGTLASFWQNGAKTWRVGERCDIHVSAF